MILFLLLGFCLAVGKTWYWARNGFGPRQLYGWTQEKKGVWWNEEAEIAISQPFLYLGRGRQAFAFASADGKYVLKFPRGALWKLSFWLRSLPLKERRHRRICKKAIREGWALESARLAIEELPDATGLIGMNLSVPNPAAQLKHKQALILDKIGRTFHIPLDRTYFVLQRRKRLFKDEILDAASKEGRAGVERVLDVMLKLIAERTSRGILNRDGSFLRNYGFDEQGAYQTDIGSFFRVQGLPDSEIYARSIALSIGPMRRWMNKNHPEWLELLERACQTHLGEAVRRKNS